MGKHGKPLVSSKYMTQARPGHPTAHSDGRVRVHRAVLFDAIGYRHEPIPRDSGWEQSIWRFCDLADAVKIACGNSRISPDATWRYMCGIAWKMLAEVQESAREAVHGGE